ncbi:MAG: MFS transporter [Azospirillaceae bacterium]|nr:MFS transporter [Azospirillaceae bacterium]
MRMVTKMAYAAPTVGLAGLGLPLLIYLPNYYGTVVGLPLGLVGLAFLVARLADIIADPLAAVVLDNTRSAFGRFRLWLVIGTPFLIVSVFGLFMPPKGASATYLSLCLAGTYAAWSLCSVAHVAWGGSLSDDYDERNAIFAWAQAFFMVGGLAITALPLLPALKATPAATVPAMGWFIMAATPVGVALAVLLVREPPAAWTRRPAWRDYARLLAQGDVARLLGSSFLTSLALYGSGAVFFFYYPLFHGLSPLQTASLLFVLKLGAIAGGYLWSMLGTLMEKHRALALGFAAQALLYPVVHLLPWSSPKVGMVILAGFGITLSAAPVLMRSMMADLGDQWRLSSGTDQLGALSALFSIIDKLAAAVAPALALMALDRAGFNPQGAEQTGQATTALSVAAIWVPAVLCLLAIPLVRGHRLTADRHQAVRRELALLEAGG